jgi:hypothetical protein
MTTSRSHNESLEFGIAKKIWDTAKTDEARHRAINLYKIAAEKNDGRALLEIYKIKIDFYDHLLSKEDRLRKNLRYLIDSMELGHVEAFLYAASIDGIFSKYQKLVYLAAGMQAAKFNGHEGLSELQEIYVSAIDNFPSELVRETIEIGSSWLPGAQIQTTISDFEGKLVEHPQRYVKGAEEMPEGWQIFEEAVNTEEYLRLLPGSADYFSACEAEEKNNPDEWKSLMLAAAGKGNGQAIYALGAYQHGQSPLRLGKSDIDHLLNAAANGSIDAFLDLADIINNFYERNDYDVDAHYDFFNTANFTCPNEAQLMSAIRSSLYIFTIMERLGIQKYFLLYLQVGRFSAENDSGYQFDRTASPHDLKYTLVSHKESAEINRRAYLWKIGRAFDGLFCADINILLGKGS